jgi:uncharacterized protein (UPF0276 family)
MPKLATPISHLFENDSYRVKITAVSDCLECRDEALADKAPNQELFHCELQPIHPFSKAHLAHLAEVKEMKPDLKLISFHAASCYDKPVIKKGRFQPGGKSFSAVEMASYFATNIKAIKNIFGADVRLAMENNNYYQTPAYDIVTDPRFLSKLVTDNDIHFLFDIAHAKISAHNSGVTFDAYCNQLPLDKMIQIHLCKSSVNMHNEAVDTHDLPNEADYSLTSRLCTTYNVAYVTIEYYKDCDNLVNALKALKGYL